MNLRDFVKGSIFDILGAISDVRKDIGVHGGRLGVVNPVWNDLKGSTDEVMEVAFDVAVTASEKSGDEKGAISGEIQVVTVKIGAKFEGKTVSEEKNETISRISFKVRILPPIVAVKTEHNPTLNVG